MSVLDRLPTGTRQLRCARRARRGLRCAAGSHHLCRQAHRTLGKFAAAFRTEYVQRQAWVLVAIPNLRKHGRFAIEVGVILTSPART